MGSLRVRMAQIYPDTSNPRNKKGYEGTRQTASGRIPGLIHLFPIHSQIYTEEKKIYWYVLNIPGYFVKADNDKASPVVNNEN